MKRIIRLTFFLLLVFNINSFSQESRFHGFLNLNTAHFSNRMEGYKYLFPIEPGIESGIWFDLMKNVSLGTGISFQIGRLPYYRGAGQDFGELSIPFLIKYSTSGTKLKYFATAGFYLGNISVARNFSWVMKSECISYWNIDLKFSTPDYKADLILCPGVEYQVSKNLGISFSPFMKYRFFRAKDYSHIMPLYYGLKIGARFSIKEKERLFRGNFLSKIHLIVRAGVDHFSFPGNSLLKGDTSFFYSFPLDPCMEINFAYDFDKNNSIGTGISFQSARIVDYENHFSFSEVSIPLYYSLNIFRKNKLSAFISAGMSYGLKTFWEEFMYKYNIQGEKYAYPVSRRKLRMGEYPLWERETYSSNLKFLDLFLEPGIKYVISDNILIQASPHLKFRIKDQFFDDTNSLILGFKAGVQFNFD